MRRDFQLDLLSALALGGAGAQAEPPSLELGGEVLEVVVEHTKGLILNDQGFKDAVAKALEKRHGREPEGSEVTQVLNSAADLAAAEVRKKLAGKRVEGGTWDVVQSVLRTVLDVQAKTYLDLSQALEVSESSNPLEAQAFRSIQERLGLAKEVAQMAKLLPEEVAQRALHVAGEHVLLRNADLRQMRNTFTNEVHWFLLRSELQKGHQAILAMCRNLMLDGRVHRFEIGEIDKALSALEQREIPREQVLEALDRLLSRWTPSRLREIHNPWR